MVHGNNVPALLRNVIVAVREYHFGCKRMSLRLLKLTSQTIVIIIEEVAKKKVNRQLKKYNEDRKING